MRVWEKLSLFLSLSLSLSLCTYIYIYIYIYICLHTSICVSNDLPLITSRPRYSLKYTSALLSALKTVFGSDEGLKLTGLDSAGDFLINSLSPGNR
jgi:hypothetical protein